MDRDGDNRHLTIARTTKEDGNKIAILVDGCVDRDASVAEVIGTGIVFELLSVRETASGDQEILVRISAPDEIRIERHERLEAPTRAERLENFGAVELNDFVDENASIEDLEDWIINRKKALAGRDKYIRDLREQQRKAHNAGHHHANNRGHLRYTMLAEETNIAVAQREEINLSIEAADVILKRKRRERSEVTSRTFHAEFVRLAKEKLDRAMFEELSQKAAAAART